MKNKNPPARSKLQTTARNSSLEDGAASQSSIYESLEGEASGRLMTDTESQPPKLVPPAKHKVRHRKVKQGETIYKGHPSWNMMLNIKLGVSYSVGRIASEGNRQLAHRDFKTVFKQEFPPEGSPLTPGAAPCAQTLARAP